MQGAGDDTTTQTGNENYMSNIESNPHTSGGGEGNQNNWNVFQNNGFSSFQEVQMEQEAIVNKQTKVKSPHLKNVIPLETGSTPRETIMNPNLITDITTSRNPVGMTTNDGKILYQKPRLQYVKFYILPLGLQVV